jgi:tetratricopeptide (TPR) repeat protein
MSTEVLLDLIKRKFTADEGKILVESLIQDPLIWQFINNEEQSLPYFQTAQNDLQAFSPGAIAQWLIEKSTGLPLEDLKNFDVKLPQPIRQRSAQAFETVISTGLPPADLLTAGLLALTLRERRVLKGSWEGITEDMFLKMDRRSSQKFFNIWRTPIAILLYFCGDFDSFMANFFHAHNDITTKSSIPILVHALLSNPSSSRELEDKLFGLLQNLPIDIQLDSLKWLRKFHKEALTTSLAKHLIQTKSNLDAFAYTFSELEAFETGSNKSDFLESVVAYTLPEDVNRLAAFYFFSGDLQKAVETYQRSSQLLNFLRAQTLFQSATCNSNDPKAQAHWLQIIKAIPLSKQARYFYVQSLIDQNQFEEAQRHLKELPVSPETDFLSKKLETTQGNVTGKSWTLTPFSKTNEKENFKSLTSYYANDVKLNTREELLKLILKKDIIPQDSSWVQNLLNTQHNNLEIIDMTRDFLEKTGEIDKAIELTALLERAKPASKTEKQTLSRLYCLSERWEDAFNELQTIIKSETSPDLDDLGRFAESALKTNHVDMAISICQNILKQDKTNTKALILLGESYMEKGDTVKAIQHMEQVVEMIPDEGETWLALARIWTKNGQADRAFEVLSKGVLALPNEAKLLRALGQSHLERQAPADALTSLSKAYELDPGHFMGRLNLAKAKFQLGQYQSAYELLSDEMDHYRDNPEIANLLGHVLLAMDDKNSAEPVLLFAAEQEPNDIYTVMTAANLILENEETTLEEKNLNKLDQIKDILTKSLLNDPENLQIKVNLADVDRLSGRPQEALEAYSKLSEIDLPEDANLKWRLAYGLGKAALDLDNADLALAALQEANVKKSGNLMILHSLAEAYQHNQLLDKAQHAAKSALKTAPQDTNNILWYADFKINNNEPEEAIKALKEASEINPDRMALKLWLSKTLLSTGSINESLEILKNLITGSRASASDLHQAAYICVELNKADLAVQALEKSINLSNEFSPVKNLDLISAYTMNGQTSLALEMLDAPKIHKGDYAEFSMMKADLLESLGQYNSAFQTIKAISPEQVNESINPSLEEKSIQKSPLLYNYDFSEESVYFRLGKLSRSLGNIKQAQDYFLIAHGMNPKNIRLQNAVVESYLVGLDYKNAIEFAEKQMDGNGLVVDVETQHLFCNYLEALIENEENQKVEELLQNISGAQDISIRIKAVRSRLLANNGDYQTAERELLEVTSQSQNFINPSSLLLENAFQESAILSSIASAFFDLEKFEEAQTYYVHANEVLAHQPLHCLGFAQTLIKLAEKQQVAKILLISKHAPGKFALAEEAQKKCDELINVVGDFLPGDTLMCLKARKVAAFTGKWPLSLNADLCLTSPDSAAAIIMSTDNEALVQEILQSYPDQLEVLQAFGILALKNEKLDAIPHLQKALDLDTSNPINHILLALLKQNQPQEAVQLLEIALNLWPDEPEWHMLASEMYDVIGDTESASRHITQALSSNPENAKYWEKSGEINLKLNNLSEAKTDIEKSANLQSNDPAIWMKMAKINRRTGNAAKAIENLRKASLLDPDNSDIDSEEIKLLLEQKNFKEAENKATKTLEAHPSNNQIRIYLAQAKAKQGKIDEALAFLDMQVGPKDPKITLEVLKIRKDQEGIEKFLPDLIQLAEKFPKNPDVLSTLTDWLIQINRLDQAEKTAQTVLRIIPEQADVHLMLGRLQRKNGQLDQAIAHLSDAIAYDPLLVEAYIELGKTYQERRDMEKAIKVFQKGTQANPSDARPYYFAAMALKEIKNYRDAEIMLKEAKIHDPEDPNIIRQLGVVTALNLIHKLRETR